MERHFQCTVEMTGGGSDEGRDLLIHHPDGLIIVECKHYPRGTVGRPIVQKLHSALITGRSRRGMVLTTGRISAEAVEYANRLTDVSIELFDGNRLAITAQRLGISVTEASAGGLAIPTTADGEFPPLVIGSILGPEKFRPPQGAWPRVDVSRQTEYVGYFVSQFSAYGEANTAIGTQSAAWEGECWITIDGRKWSTGNIPGIWPDFPQPIELSAVIHASKGHAAVPRLQMTDALKALKDGLSNHLVEHVNYTGKNNVNYTKKISPGKRNIQLNSTKLLYVPHQRVRIAGLGEAYEGELVETSTELHLKCGELSSCSVCGGTVTPDTQTICGVCHRSVHRRTLLRPESGTCEACSATLCRRHIRVSNKSSFCPTCAPFEAKRAWHRLAAPGLFGFLATVTAAIHGELTAWVHLNWDIGVTAVGWLPFSIRAWPVGISRKGNPLAYPKGVPMWPPQDATANRGFSPISDADHGEDRQDQAVTEDFLPSMGQSGRV